ncbi:hypothetical protein D3C84_331240 [compost metagenome]
METENKSVLFFSNTQTCRIVTYIDCSTSTMISAGKTKSVQRTKRHEINQKQISSVRALPPEKRYEHFVKVVADWQEVWGLYNDGWALAATDTDITVFPMWPTKEYAALCAEREWAGCNPEKFSLDDMLSELLPKLKRDGFVPGIFYTPTDNGVTPSIDQFVSDLSEELKKY